MLVAEVIESNPNGRLMLRRPAMFAQLAALPHPLLSVQIPALKLCGNLRHEVFIFLKGDKM